MRFALFWSGGKDSLLALDRARRQGIEVSHLVNIYEGCSGRVRFHGVRKEAIAAQAEALGMELLQKNTHPQNFEQTFQSALGDLQGLGIRDVIFGNIHLADIRAWYEQRTTAMGFRHLEPLWGESPSALIREFVDRGYRARIVSVYLICGRPEWIGKEFSKELIIEIERTEGVDVCGERGEYHSFAFGGPLFEHPLTLQYGSQLEVEDHLVLDFWVDPIR